MKAFLLSYVLILSTNLFCKAQCPAPNPSETTVCGSGSRTITAYTMTPSANLQHNWWTAATGGSMIQGVVIQNTGGYPLVSNYTTNINQTTTFYVSTFNTATFCESARVAITITIQQPPSVSVTSASLCGAGSTVLTATAPAGSSIIWTNASGTQVATGSKYTTPFLGSSTFYNVAFNVPGSCATTKRADVTVNSYSYSLTVAPVKVCSGQSATLVASGGISGSYYYWYDANYNLLQSTASNTYTTAALSAVTRFFVSYMNTAPPYCTTPLVLVDVQVGPPDAPGVTNRAGCGGSQVTLSASGLPSGATYRWYNSSSTLLQESASPDFITPALEATTTYHVAIFKGCESSRTPVTATINSVPAVSPWNGTSCGPGQVTFYATTLAQSTNLRHDWWTAPTGGSIVSGTATENNGGYPFITRYTTTISQTTTYYISTFNTVNFCQTSRVPITVTVETPPAVSVSSVALCGAGPAYLSATAPAGSTITWRNASGTQVTTGNKYITPLLASSTYYDVSFTVPGACAITKRADVTVNNYSYSLTVAPVKVCSGQTATLVANGGISGSYYYWYDANYNLLQSTASNTYTTGALSAVTRYYVSYMNTAPPYCTTPLVPVDVQVGPPDAPGVTNRVGCGGSQVTLSASGLPSGATYRWYNSSSTLLQESASPDFITPALEATTTYHVAIFTGCESSRTPVTATINSVPAVSPWNGTSCGPGEVTFTATTLAQSTNLRHDWWTAPTGGSIVSGITTENNGGYPYMTRYTTTISQTTTYYVSTFNTANFCQTPRVPITVTVETPPPVSASSVSLCGAGPAYLSATAPAGSTITWRNASGTQVATGNKYVTPFLSSNTYYNVSFTVPGACAVTKRADVTVNNYPLTLTINPVQVCASDPATLVANGGTSGSYYFWYDADYNLLQSTASNTYETPALMTNTRYYAYILNTSPPYCTTPLVSIDVTVRPPLGLPSSEATTYTFEDEDLFEITATPGVNGDICRWYTVAIGGDPEQGNTYVPPMIGATTRIFYVSSYSLTTGCESVDRLPVTVNVSPIANRNYIRENVMRISGVISTSAISNLTVIEREQNWTYFDGLGRPMQNVQVQASPLHHDMVTPVVYDVIGRENRKYLPFVPDDDTGYYKDNNTVIDPTTGSYVGMASNLYNAMVGAVADDGGKPFSETLFEPSPLNRPLKQGAPGSSWQPIDADPYSISDNTVKMRYEINGTDEVILFTYDPATGLISSDNSGSLNYYEAGQLYANKTYDEHNNIIIEFSDKEGRTVCKKVQSGGTIESPEFASTYYIYDDFGNLVVVLPPEGVKALTEQ